MGLIAYADGRRKFVPAGDEPVVDAGDTLLLVRNRLLTIPFTASACPSSCDNLVDVSGELQVRWDAGEADLGALLRTLLAAREELTLTSLAEALSSDGLESVLVRFIRQQPATALVHDDQREPLFAVLRESLKRFAFETGLRLERIASVSFTSETLAQYETLRRATAARVERIRARELIERSAVAATERRLGHLGSLLDKLRRAAGDEGSGRWHDLLPALSPGERGKLLENLWRITPDRDRAQAIVVVAGQECVWLAKDDPQRIEQRVVLPDDLGGLRSASFCRRSGRLLIGAATGVWMLAPDSGEIAGRFAVPDAGQPRTGFNAATCDGARLYATHSQLGCWAWPLSSAAPPEPLLQPRDGQPRTVRSVCVTDDGRILFATDDTVHVRDADGQSLDALDTGGDVIHSLAVLDEFLYVGTVRGRLLQDTLDGTGGTWLVLHRAPAAIESIIARRWTDLIELVIPAGVDGVCGIYGEEGVVARLLEAPQPIRRVWACDDLLLGMTETRDRLVVAHAGSSDRSGVSVSLAQHIGRTVQDACIVLEVEPPDSSKPAEEET